MITRNEALRTQLETQAGQIEQVLAGHGITAVVTGGKILAHSLRFEVQVSSARMRTRLSAVQAALAESLGDPEVLVFREERQLTVQVALRSEADFPRDLLSLLKSAGHIRPFTTVLGAAKDGRPLMLQLDKNDVTNILVVGQPGAGKTDLLRAFLFSLAAKNKQRQLQAVVIDYDPQAGTVDSALTPFNHLPHLVEPVATSFKAAVEALDLLVDETQYRLKQELTFPRIVALIDNLDALLAAGEGAVLRRLIYLLENGTAVGLNLVLALEDPTGPFTNLLMKCDLPVRLVGRVENDKKARAAAGLFDTGAEMLGGQGDFVGVFYGTQLRFQVAPISDYDLYLAVDKLKQKQKKRQAAESAVFRSRLAMMKNPRLQ